MELDLNYLKKQSKYEKKLNLNGMIWQVLDWNSPAIDFYRKFDAEISKDWLNGKLTKKQIENINKIL